MPEPDVIPAEETTPDEPATNTCNVCGEESDDLDDDGLCPNCR